MEYFNVILIFIVLTIIAPTLSKSVFPTRAYCGFQHSDDYVRDNDNISLDEFPWIAQLLYHDGHEDKIIKCVGSLINRRYVLTAAHCLFIPAVSDVKITAVRLGDTDVTTVRDCVNHTRFGEECSDPVEEFDIEELILHPKYRRRDAVNDIGLIRLSRDVSYSDYIRPICLPAINSLDLKDGLQLAVSGWGLESFDGLPTKVKKKISAILVPASTCRILFNKDRNIFTDNYLCVKEEDERYTCQGDSGGPLMLSARRNQWEQVGIVSFGKSTCPPGYPSAYVKVSRYLDWIRENVHA